MEVSRHVPRPECFISEEWVRSIQWIWGRMDPRAAVDVTEERKDCLPAARTSNSSTVELVVLSLCRLSCPGYQSHRIHSESMCIPLKYDDSSFWFLFNVGTLLSLQAKIPLGYLYYSHLSSQENVLRLSLWIACCPRFIFQLWSLHNFQV
jgi:hypothetical protein